MIYKNGVYLSIDGNSVVQIIVENSAKVQAEKQYNLRNLYTLLS